MADRKRPRNGALLTERAEIQASGTGNPPPDAIEVIAEAGAAANAPTTPATPPPTPHKEEKPVTENPPTVPPKPLTQEEKLAATVEKVRGKIGEAKSLRLGVLVTNGEDILKRAEENFRAGKPVGGTLNTLEGFFAFIEKEIEGERRRLRSKTADGIFGKRK